MTTAKALPTQEKIRQIQNMLGGPHEWGYRDVTDGKFIADYAPFEAASMLEALGKAVAETGAREQQLETALRLIDDLPVFWRKKGWMMSGVAGYISAYALGRCPECGLSRSDPVKCDSCGATPTELDNEARALLAGSKSSWTQERIRLGDDP